MTPGDLAACALIPGRVRVRAMREESALKARISGTNLLSGQSIPIRKGSNIFGSGFTVRTVTCMTQTVSRGSFVS